MKEHDMKMSEAFPSLYVTASDLGDRDVSVVISSVEKWTPPPRPGERETTKLLLHFQNRQKGFVANKTNCARIEAMYGDETDDWIGKEIVLGTEFVDFKGQTTKAIRVQLRKRSVKASNGPVHTVTDKGSYGLSSIEGRHPSENKGHPFQVGRVAVTKQVAAEYPDVPDDGDPIPF
jgi:hypothetical protein